MSDDGDENPEDIDDESDDAEEGGDAEAVVAEAKELYEIDENHWNPIYKAAKDDLDFLSDEEGSQWPDTEYKDRKDSGRPALQMDYLTQFVHQVANNIRMNTPSINPIPSGDGASIEDAKMLKGLIRKIEYASRADQAYDNAATGAVKCSIGYVTVDHDYINEDTNEQQLKICKVINQFLVFPDSRSIESDGSDQDHCTILEAIRVKDFKSEFPGKEVRSFDEEPGEAESVSYGDNDEIMIAHFFQREKKKVKTTVLGKSRTKTEYTINRYKLSGVDVLAQTTFPGDYVPVVPFYGEEAWNNGKRRIHSLIRKSKEPQYMFNVTQSVTVEAALKQPLAPVQAPAGSVENYADDWKNPSKTMVLRYDMQDADGNTLAKPERLMPPQVPAGLVQLGMQAVDNIKATLGLYNQSLGEQGNETSGKAINARKIQGDVATYHFGDNAVRSIAQVGRILVCARQAIYDTERVVDIIDEEDKPQEVGINGALADKQEKTHNINKGKYDVRVITGQSFTTRRQESAAFYQDLVKSNEQMLMLCGDLMFENMDIEGAPAMASRMKKVMSPKLFDDDGADPQIAALTQQLQQAQQIIEAGAQELQKLQEQLKQKQGGELAKQQNESRKNDILEMKTRMDSMVKLLQLSLQDRSNDITEQKNVGDLAIKSKGQHFDQIMSIMDSLTAALPEQQGLNGEAVNTPANDGGVVSGEQI